MKKILITLLAVSMSLSLFACGNDSEPMQDNQPASVSSRVENSDIESPSTDAADYDWTNVFSSMDLDNPFRVRFVETAPISAVTGAVGHIINDVVQIVDYKSVYSESDFGVDASKATSADKIVKTFESTFVKLVQYDVTAVTSFGDPHIDIAKQENVKVNSYNTCKSTGTYYYYPMMSKQGDKETELYFASYATFLKDGTPVYVAAVDASEDQSMHNQCDQVALDMMKSLEEVSKDVIMG